MITTQYFKDGPLDGQCLSLRSIVENRVINMIQYTWTGHKLESSITGESAWLWQFDAVNNNLPVSLAFLSLENGMSLVEKVWTKADRAYEKLADLNANTNTLEPNPERDMLRGRLNAFADVLAIFMSPHYKTPAEIAEELTRRYEAKKGDEAYETKGLGSRQYEFNRPPEPKVTVLKTAGRTVTTTVSKGLSDKEKASIKFAAQSGMFTNEQLSKTYGVSIEAIEKIISS